ncbi:MAG TPA: dihydrolipoamide acetyltransferase family protein [Methanomassiliicoccaceae archaeon]|nr:dihydrolipoamide acetyltransferase family protein [Methanomassiliicoccaceae archaeon]
MEFKFPDLGEGVTEGELRKWLVKVGDVVKKDQSIAEMETDKAIVEMPSPVAGRIAELLHEEGGTVRVGEVLAVIEEEPSEERPKEEAPSEEKAPLEEMPAEEGSVSVVGELPVGEELAAARPATDKVLATPAVRRLAREMKIDITKIKGTGPDGRVTEDDVRSFAPVKEERVAPAMQPKFDLYGWVDRVPLKGIRRSTARHMIEAQTASAQVTVMDVADVTDLVALRERVKEYAMREKGVKLTYLPFVIKAVVAALKRHPYLNAELNEETQEILLKKYYNIGVAVATDDGLMVPVIKAADAKDVYALAKEMAELSEQARSRRIDLGDLRGGTFTITNYGVFGGTFATPIANHPEVAILGTGRISDRPMVHDGEIAIRKVMHLSLTFDHRVLDGAEAAKFLNDLIRFLEDPALALMEP